MRSSAAARDRVSGQVGAQQLERVLGEADPDRAVVGDQPLPARELAQRGRRGRLERQRELHAARRPACPGVTTPICHSASRRAQALAGARPGEPLERVPARARARREIARVGVVAAALALGDQRPDLLLLDAEHVAEADPHRPLAPPGTRPRSG